MQKVMRRAFGHVMMGFVVQVIDMYADRPFLSRIIQT